jgi:hypothetical protein
MEFFTLSPIGQLHDFNEVFKAQEFFSASSSPLGGPSTSSIFNFNKYILECTRIWFQDILMWVQMR